MVILGFAGMFCICGLRSLGDAVEGGGVVDVVEARGVCVRVGP